MKSETLKFRLGPQLKEELEHAAYDQEMRLGEFIRYALSEYLRSQENPTNESDQHTL
jgi:predicted HicB family RNase H-like nuclease